MSLGVADVNAAAVRRGSWASDSCWHLRDRNLSRRNRFRIRASRKACYPRDWCWQLRFMACFSSASVLQVLRRLPSRRIGPDPCQCVEKAFEDLLLWFARALYRFVCPTRRLTGQRRPGKTELDAASASGAHDVLAEATAESCAADFLLLNGTLHYERDVQDYLTRLRAAMRAEARLIVVYYSSLWRPVLGIATRLGLRTKTLEWNWLSHGDVANFMHLADLEVVRREPKVLMPIYVPLLSEIVNRYLAPLPLLSAFVSLTSLWRVLSPLQTATSCHRFP